MFTSSICRVARPPSAATLPTSTARSSSAVIAAATSGFVGNRTHQRRYSSSKPPVPPSDGSRGINTSSQAPAEDVQPSNAEKREGKAAKRRARDGNGNRSKNEPYLNLPSVPSTQHLSPQDIHLASFFSVHRPMSITTAIPPNSDNETFSSIFEPKKNQSKSRHNEVIYTLSSALNAIENASSPPTKSGRQQRSSPEEGDLRKAVTQASSSNAEPHVLHLDEVSPEQLASSIQEYAKTLRPFNPPPAPAPINEKGNARSSEDTQIHANPFAQIQDLEAPSGAEEGKIIEDGHKRQRRVRFLERKRAHQSRWGNSIRQQSRLHERTMHTLSVKRQRKLKMKKHKRKKFLRRTRSLRHKLGKA